MGLPPTVWRIVAVEGLERFAYYGFRAILTLYLIRVLGMAESEAVACFSFTSALAYSSPLGGAWLSDEKWGRFATICSLGSVYAVGLWLLVGAAATASAAGTAAALLLVGLGTGGIKPCVSSFGADQIGLGDADATRRYFALFYASINVGSTVSFLVTPAVRAFFGYAAAFALPAALLAAGLAVFVSGKNRYVRLPPKPGGAGVVGALRRAFAGGDDAEAAGLRSVGEVLALLPIFWMLYDQQGSVWVVQAAEMENFGGKLQPEQLGVANPVLILLLLPLFEKSIYPALERKGFSTSAPRRMCAGMVVASVAFFVAAAVDLRLAEGRRVNILWQLPQIFLITVAEILVSVTGLEYSYTRAPESLRASVSALYLLTTAVGDVLAGVLFAAAGRLGIARPLVLFACAAAMLATAFAFTRVARAHFVDDGRRSPVGSPATMVALEEDDVELQSSRTIGEEGGGLLKEEGGDLV